MNITSEAATEPDEKTGGEERRGEVHCGLACAVAGTDYCDTELVLGLPSSYVITCAAQSPVRPDCLELPDIYITLHCTTLH